MTPIMPNMENELHILIRSFDLEEIEIRLISVSKSLQ